MKNLTKQSKNPFSISNKLHFIWIAFFYKLITIITDILLFLLFLVSIIPILLSNKYYTAFLRTLNPMNYVTAKTDPAQQN